METQLQSGSNVNNETLLKKGAETLGLSLEERCIQSLLTYFQELKRWSLRINLISRGSDDKQIIDTHFLDSLSLLLLLEKEKGVHLLDVGSGAGFPGLVLAVALPDASFTLLEPRLKRVSFLRHIIRLLGLNNVKVEAKRVEELGRISEGSYTHITSRAVAAPADFLSMSMPFLKQGATAIIMAAKEESLQTAFDNNTSVRIESSHTLHLPYSNAERVIAAVVSFPVKDNR